ncbi:c-type cytochrome [Flavobacterium silvaticum]|uniref:C-type cytochrome n=1 Tax=Flavobacterium silvaticum TaxID=1852020 RepID=A0A972JHU8_9FLAO|nr:c-type cytochrome [Flavobacterium silvaticum]NMH28320.1 c-type cytochrome [Flavobacterium silvaticum]
MNRTLSLFFLLLLLGCKSKESAPEQDFSYEDDKLTPVQHGQKIFEGKGNCTACHQPEQKIIGPSLKEIASVYKNRDGAIVKFLKEESEPIVDPAQYAAMKVNFTVTKRMTDEELQALEAYIYSIK